MRCSIKSKNSPHASASAPGADQIAKILQKNFCNSSRQLSHPMAVHTCVDNCWNHTAGVVLRSTTSRVSPAIPTSARVRPQVTHNPKRGRPAPTPLYPQLPQDLILLLIYLHRFLSEEVPWGQRVTTRSRHVADRRCHPDRLAFKMDQKALRWFFDSRYGRCSDVGGPVSGHRETAG